MSDELTRRRFLAIGATGTAGFAGCADVERETKEELSQLGIAEFENDGSGPASAAPNRPPIQPVDGEMAWYQYRDAFPEYAGWPAAVGESPFREYYRYDDGPPVTVTGDSVTVEFGGVEAVRPTVFTARYARGDGTVGATSKHIRPGGGLLESVAFDVDGREYPETAEGRVEITVRDPGLDDAAERSVARQRFVAFPYGTTAGTDVHVVHRPFFHEPSEQSISEPSRQQVLEHVDTERARVLFLVLYHDGAVFPAMTHVPHDAYRTYEGNRTNSDYRRTHNYATYAYNAVDVPYLSELAETFGASLDRAGIADRFERLQMLAYLVGNLPYETDDIEDPQVSVLYNRRGDCSEMTMLYLALMNTPAFDRARGSFIYCRLRGEGHAVIGIDERDVDPPNPDGIHWVRPVEENRERCLPDTRYAFLEVTRPRLIGAFDEETYDVRYVTDTNDLVCNTDLRTFGDE